MQQDSGFMSEFGLKEICTFHSNDQRIKEQRKHWEGHLDLETSLMQLAISNLYNCTTDTQRFPLPFVDLLYT